MLGKRTVRSPRAMMALALTTGRVERSSTVNMRRAFSSQTDGLEEEKGNGNDRARNWHLGCERTKTAGVCVYLIIMYCDRARQAAAVS